MWRKARLERAIAAGLEQAHAERIQFDPGLPVAALSDDARGPDQLSFAAKLRRRSRHRERLFVGRKGAGDVPLRQARVPDLSERRGGQRMLAQPAPHPHRLVEQLDRLLRLEEQTMRRPGIVQAERFTFRIAGGAPERRRLLVVVEAFAHVAHLLIDQADAGGHVGFGVPVSRLADQHERALKLLEGGRLLRHAQARDRQAVQRGGFDQRIVQVAADRRCP